MKDKNYLKCVPSLIGLIGVIILILVAYALLLTCCLYTPISSQLLNSGYIAIPAVFCGIFPTLILVFLPLQGFCSITTINEHGIKSVFCGKLLKKNIVWKDISYFKICNRGIVIYLFVSSNEKTKNYSYTRRVLRRDVILLPFNKKVLSFIRKYTDIIIDGVTNEQEQIILSSNKKYK